MERLVCSAGDSSWLSLPDWLAQRAALSPQRLALRAEGVEWSFAELDARVDVFARRLRTVGAVVGEPVALLMPNEPSFVEAVHGLARAGAIIVPLNVRLTPPELAWQITDVQAKWLLYHPSLNETVQSLAPLCPRVTTISVQPGGLPGDRLFNALPERGERQEERQDDSQDERQLERQSERRDRRPAERRDEPRDERVGARFRFAHTHSIVYTSGTTGNPKGAQLTFGNHWWSAVGSVLNLGLHNDDRWLACLPLFHVGGLSILMRSVIYGMPVVLQRTFDPAAVNRAIDEDGVTIVSVVSAMLRRMLDQRAGRPYPDHLRCVLVGGGPVPQPLLEAAAEQRVPVVQTYGLTETASQVATLSPADALHKLGAAGKPLFPTEVGIVRDGGPAPVGEVGEIVVRGPTVTSGYYKNSEATARAWRNGWFHTGDLGYLDDEGYLYVVERRTDLIISGGENVYPAEVEAALLAHPDIEEAGVVGVADERWGQVVAAVLKLRSGAQLNEESVREFCRERLAGYKVPRHIRFVDTLPRNSGGKLLRRHLKGLFTHTKQDG